MASSERNSSTHLSSVLNSCPTLSSVTADQLHSHKCQTSHHYPASLTQKVEKCYDSASTFFSFHLSSWGVVTIKGVKCLVELFLFVVWVCWDITALFSSLFNRLLKLHPKPALDTSQTRGRLDSNRSADCLLKWTLQNVPKILKLVLQVKIAIQLTSGKYWNDTNTVQCFVVLFTTFILCCIFVQSVYQSVCFLFKHVLGVHQSLTYKLWFFLKKRFPRFFLKAWLCEAGEMWNQSYRADE